MMSLPPFVTAQSAALALLILAAVATDVRSRRIPNRLVLAGLAIALALHATAWLSGAPSLAGAALWSPLAGLLAAGALLLPLYLLRACGAGDVKLLAMVGAFVGASVALWAAFYMLLAGGVLSIAVMLGCGVARRTLANLRTLLVLAWLRMTAGPSPAAPAAPFVATAARLPYAIPIGVGTAWALWAKSGWF